MSFLVATSSDLTRNTPSDGIARGIEEIYLQPWDNLPDSFLAFGSPSGEREVPRCCGFALIHRLSIQRKQP